MNMAKRPERSRNGLGRQGGASHLAIKVVAALVFSGLCLCNEPALAAAPQIQIPTEEQLQPSSDGPDFIGGLARTNFLLGSMGGLRPLLSRYGMSFALQETSEVWAMSPEVFAGGSNMTG